MLGSCVESSWKSNRNVMKDRWRDHLPPAIRRLLGRIKSMLFHMLYILFACRPIQPGKIVFDNYRGNGFGCNTKYVARELIKRGDAEKYDLVWLVSQTDLERGELPPQIRAVRYGSLKSFFELATAKVWVSNYHKIYFAQCGLRKRKDQFFIQMWHGSLGIKMIENHVAILTQEKRWLRAAIASSRMTDFWISNSDFETNVYKSAFWGVTDEKTLLYGHPRNDVFFDDRMMALARHKVDCFYGTDGKKLLLYAPTFREDYRTDCYRLDYIGLVHHLKSRFGGEWAVLARLHPRVKELANEILPPAAGIVDATRYADMQELLAAADCLITDYSSCAFDFMLTRRPVFLFATDVKEYDVERGFYYPLEATPFPLAQENVELMKNIDAFDKAAYLLKVEAFLAEKGCIEDGHASERVADLIERLAL